MKPNILMELDEKIAATEKVIEMKSRSYKYIANENQVKELDGMMDILKEELDELETKRIYILEVMNDK